MSAPPPSEPPTRPAWLLRRADQAAVAVLVAACLAGIAWWWIAQGALQGRLVELERADLKRCDFQVDLNKADWPELVQIPGIGETLARRIIASRTKDGPFRSPEDLRRVRGIGPKTLAKIRPYLRPLSNKPSVTEK